VLLCVTEFMHDKFPRVKTECNRAHEGLQQNRGPFLGQPISTRFI
jgi:hypothetical protein